MSGEALPAVIVPSLRNDGFSLASVSTLDPARIASSRGQVGVGHGHDEVVVEAVVPGLRRPARATGRRTRPAARGRRRTSPASCSLASPSETVHSSGMFGLTSRQPSVVDTASTLPAGNARDRLGQHPRRPGHRLDAAGQHDVGVAGLDHPRAGHRRVERRAAQPVDRRARARRPGSPPAERPSGPRCGSPRRRRWRCRGSPRSTDSGSRPGRPVADGAEHDGGQVVGAYAGQPAAELAERGADGVVDERGSHESP